MKKIFSYAMIIAASFALVACGGEEKKEEGTSSSSSSSKKQVEVKIKPTTTAVSGLMSGCFEVVDREYKLKGDSWGLGGEVIVTIKRTDKALPFDVNGEVVAYGTCCTDRDYITVGFGCEFYDADGDIVEKKDFDYLYSHEESVNIVRLPEGETATITYSLYANAEELEKITSFKVTSSYANNKATGSGSDDEDILSAAVSKASNIYDDAVSTAKNIYDDALETAKDTYKAAGAAVEAAAALSAAALEVSDWAW